MSRHRSPAGRRAHPGPVPGRAARPAAPLPAAGAPAPAVWLPQSAPPPADRPAPPVPLGAWTGPQVGPPVAPPRPPAPPGRPRHASPAARNGLTGAAATGAALAVVVPALGALPTAADDDRALTIAAAGVAAPVLATPVAGTTVDTASDTATDGPARVLLASLTPVGTTEADLPPAADAAGLIKSVGLVEAARAAEEARLAREARAHCDADLDGLGRVRPWVRDAARFLSCLYDEPTLIGVASRARVSDHPRGLAVDLMVRGERGDRIAECALANQQELGISYVIWEQRVNYGDGWERMSDRGGDTENHFDHVHISFEGSGGSGDPLVERCG